MPATVIFIKDYKGTKKGFRARMLGPVFARLKRAGIVKRVVTTEEDLKLNLYVPGQNADNTNTQITTGQPKKRGRKPNVKK